MPIRALPADLLQNELLAVLPKNEIVKILPALERVRLEVGEVLWEAGDRRQYVYFPTTAIICLLYETEDGSSTEVGIIGRQGIAGVAALMGEMEELTRAVVERKGETYRMKAGKVREEFVGCLGFQNLLHCYTQSLINQLSLTAVCYRMHTVEQQLCRWLLINHDNQQTKLFEVTHEQIANILGVRRESISLAASHLQDLGLTKGSRGRIELIDRAGIEVAACSCYVTLKNLHRKLIQTFISRHGN